MLSCNGRTVVTFTPIVAIQKTLTVYEIAVF
jgi:hypothetical protein